MSLPAIEDEFEDILGKAMRGQGFSASELASRAGVSSAACEALLSGKFDASAVRPVARALNLNADCLVQLAEQPMAPECTLPEGVRLHNTPFPIPGYEAMTVNSYSIQPPEHSGEGILIDAGSSFRSIFGDAPDNGATQWRLILTHTHSDHVIHFSELSQLVAEAHSPANEPYSDALPVRGGDAFDLGPWGLTAMETPGHSPGGMSYLLEGPSTPVAFVGDALFCYSIGKVNAHYDAALTSIREKILGLPTETILCPGHGPPTTVGFEKTHNPFFA